MDLQFINMPGYKETGQGAQESQDEGAPRAIDYSTTRVPIQDARTTVVLITQSVFIHTDL